MNKIIHHKLPTCCSIPCKTNLNKKKYEKGNMKKRNMKKRNKAIKETPPSSTNVHI
jgi:hypothetical protein